MKKANDSIAENINQQNLSKPAKSALLKLANYIWYLGFLRIFVQVFVNERR